MKKKSTKQAVLIIFAFFGLILISEGIYVLKNNNEVKIHLYLNISRLASRTSMMKSSLVYLEKAAEIRRTQLQEEYPQIGVSSDTILSSLSENEQLFESYKQTLTSLDIENLIISNYSWGKLYYNLGLLAYKNDEQQLVAPLLQSAVNTSPEWSYFYIELANFYLQAELSEKAKETLNYCLTFQFPKDHCQEFIDENLEKSKYEEVGFLEQLIEKI